MTLEANEEDICLNDDDEEIKIEYNNVGNMDEEYENNKTDTSKTLQKDMFDEYLTFTQDPDVSDNEDKDNNIEVNLMTYIGDNDSVDELFKDNVDGKAKVEVKEGVHKN